MLYDLYAETSLATDHNSSGFTTSISPGNCIGIAKYIKLYVHKHTAIIQTADFESCRTLIKIAYKAKDCRSRDGYATYTFS